MKWPYTSTISILITQVCSYYTYLLSLGDRRVESWPLMASPVPTAVLTIAYLLVRCWWWWWWWWRWMMMMVEVFFDNIFTPLCLKILSQFDNYPIQDDNTLPQAMMILCHPMPILSLPALPLRTLPHVFSSTILIEAPCLLIQPQ